MAKKGNSKVSINAVEALLKEHAGELEPVALSEGALEFTARPYVSLYELGLMAETVVNGVFTEEAGEVLYHPEYRDVMLDDMVLTVVANFKSDMSFEMEQKLISCTGVMEKILSVWDMEQHLRLLQCVDAGIAHRLAMMQSAERTRLNRTMEQLDAATEMLTGVTSAFRGVDSEALSNALAALANIDERKLASAVLDVRERKLEVVK